MGDKDHRVLLCFILAFSLIPVSLGHSSKQQGALVLCLGHGHSLPNEQGRGVVAQ